MDLGFAVAQEADGDWGDDDLEPAPDTVRDTKAVDNANGGASPVSPEEQALPQQPQPTSSPVPDGLPEGMPKSKIHANPRTRYFVIKSNNHKNLVLSIENNVWATQRHNEEKLNEALQNAPHVILIFSVNCSGCFQGYAKMVGAVGSSKKTHVFPGYARAFDVKWLRLDDLDFAEVASISNPWNEHKSVKISRDGQELPNDVGRRLCEMVDQRVYTLDPAGYATDEAEVETGGFIPLLQPPPPEPPPQAHQNDTAPVSDYGQLGPHAPVPGFGVPGPPMPPWSPWGPVPPWAYPQWLGDSSSYSSYSYSESESESETKAAPTAPQMPCGQPHASAVSAAATVPAAPSPTASMPPPGHGTPDGGGIPPEIVSAHAAPRAQAGETARRHKEKKEKKSKKEKAEKRATDKKQRKENGIKAQPKEPQKRQEGKTHKHRRRHAANEKGEKSDKASVVAENGRREHKEKKSKEVKEVKQAGTKTRRHSRGHHKEKRKHARHGHDLRSLVPGAPPGQAPVARLSPAPWTMSYHPMPPTHQGPSGHDPGAYMLPPLRARAPPPEDWRGPGGRPPGAWVPSVPGYRPSEPPPPGHQLHAGGSLPPRPGHCEWGAGPPPRGVPPLDWHGACPVRD